MKITIRNLQKKKPVNPKRIKKAILSVFSSEGIKNSGEICVSFVTDAKIRGLNKKYCGKDFATDVLAFDITAPNNPESLLADVIVSCDTAARQASVFKTSLAYELKLYAVHGALHLLGYDDRTPAQRRLMQKKEKEYVDTQNRSDSLK